MSSPGNDDKEEVNKGLAVDCAGETRTGEERERIAAGTESTAATAAAAAFNDNTNDNTATNTTNPTWDEMYQQLVAYRHQHGDCNVPALYADNKKLGKWVSRQRLAKKNNTLSQRRLEKLDAIDFIWDCQAYKAERQWQEKFQSLREHYKNTNSNQQQEQQQEGDANIASTYYANTAINNNTLPKEMSTWVSKQRALQRVGQLSQERKAQLDSIGFVWQLNPPSEEEEQARLEREEMEWMEHFQKLKRQVQQLQLPQEHQLQEVSVEKLLVLDGQTTSWLEQQRNKKGPVLDHRRKLLEDIGIKVPGQQQQQQCTEDNTKTKKRNSKSSVLEEQWNEKFLRMQVYHALHHSFEVPNSDTQNLDLHRWVKRQRLLYRQGNLEASRQQRLTDIGFDFKTTTAATATSEDEDGNGILVAKPHTHDANWENKFQRLKDFQAKHGHVMVTLAFPEDADLYRWVRRQRELYRLKTLDPQRWERLEELGLAWEPERKKRKQPGEDNQHDNSEEPVQKKATTRKNPRFEENLNKLKTYLEENGDTNVPRDYKPDPALSHFVANQRKQYKVNKMPQDRKAALDAIGFCWNLKEQRPWEENFRRLVAYKNAKGDCNVPCRWSEDPGLASFVNFQRRKYRESKLSDDHKEQLQSIGFEFDVLPFGAQKRKGDRPALKMKQEARVTEHNEKRWNEMYEALEEYKKEHGHVNVPLRDKEHKKLGKWVSHQRLSCVRQDRRDKLDQLDFVWNASTLTSKKRQLDEKEREEEEAAEKQRLAENTNRWMTATTLSLQRFARKRSISLSASNQSESNISAKPTEKSTVPKQSESRKATNATDKSVVPKQDERTSPRKRRRRRL